MIAMSPKTEVIPNDIDTTRVTTTIEDSIHYIQKLYRITVSHSYFLTSSGMTAIHPSQVRWPAATDTPQAS